MFNQISRIRVTAKKSLQQEQTFFLQCSSLFLRTFVPGLLNQEFCLWSDQPKNRGLAL